MGLFNYGGLMAIQTLWAGPWMIRVAGYTPIESATGLFWINITMLFSFFIWGYFYQKLMIKDLVHKNIKIGFTGQFYCNVNYHYIWNKAGAAYSLYLY